jgi:hypothetical protein
MVMKRNLWLRRLLVPAAALAALVALSGCVIYDYGPPAHHWHYGYWR